MSFTGIPVTGKTIIKFTSIQTSSVTTTTATIPLDNTVPLVTEGAEFFSDSFSFTPGNFLLIEGIFYCSSSSGTRAAIVAVFRDSTCMVTVSNRFNNANVMRVIPYMTTLNTSELTSPTTISVRAGLNAAGTLAMNGNPTQLFGGTAGSYLRIMEIQ